MRDLLQLLRDELLRQLGVAKQDCIEEHRAKGVLALSGDGTWGQTANARFCTTTLMGLTNRCFVAVVHLTHDPRLKASTGFMIKVECSSKGMEAIVVVVVVVVVAAVVVAVVVVVVVAAVVVAVVVVVVAAAAVMVVVEEVVVVVVVGPARTLASTPPCSWHANSSYSYSYSYSPSLCLSPCPARGGSA